jgi:hypothetical protein
VCFCFLTLIATFRQEKELRELSENPDLLSGFERDFDDDDDSLPASVPSILIEQRQKHPVAAAGETVTKDSGNDLKSLRQINTQ